MLTPHTPAYASRAEAREAGEWFKKVADGVFKYGGETTNTAGGFLVPQRVAEAIMDLRDKVGVARQLMDVVPVGTANTAIPKRTSGPTAGYVDENAETTASEAGFDSVNVTPKKITALVRASSELMEDAANLGEFLTQEIAHKLEQAIDAAAFAGDGTSTYKGITGVRKAFTNNTSLAGYVLATSGNDTWAEYTVADMAAAVGALPSAFHDNAAWVCSPIAYALTICRLVGAGGGPLMVERRDGSVGPAFLGYPVYLTTQMQGGTSTTDLSNLVSFVFGDFRKAGVLADRRGITVVRSDERYIEYDQVGFRGTSRFDVVWHGIGDTIDAGAVVALVGN